jgi:hypothetical protein
VDEQETFRKRRVAGHNLRSRTSARASLLRQCCTTGRRHARSGMARTGIFEWRWLGQESGHASGLERRAYCASFRSTLSLSTLATRRLQFCGAAVVADCLHDGEIMGPLPPVTVRSRSRFAIVRRSRV